MGKRRNRQKIDPTPQIVNIDSIAHDGRGVGRDPEGKVVFVDYALPGEQVEFVPHMKRAGHLFGTTQEVLKASEFRIEPRCEVFGQCGGCVLQHLEADKAIEYKSEQLLENLKKIGNVVPEEVLEPMIKERWGYRRRARLGAKFVPKKGGLIVGFRERNSSYIQPIDRCHVLDQEVSDLIPALRECLSKLSIHNQIPQIEIAVADNSIVLVIRHLDAFTTEDLAHLTEFAKAHKIQMFLQPNNLKSVHPLYPENPEPLMYSLPAHDIVVEFLPTDFIQVNGSINQALVSQAIDLLDLKPNETVLDLFSGVGNFTLPLARAAHTVVGVEGDHALVERANHNKALNKLDNVEFFYGDLFKEDMTSASHGDWLDRQYDKILLDPPRSGAAEMIKRIKTLNPSKIVYVSCGPATLARDAGALVNEHGYRLTKAGVIDMFPHTAHVESIAVFERD
ncbi:MAG: 23S rRNA (uracil(1939)-C(5))-methyltransferase RlmD [Arenicella sp.]|jgi:23S rRNA (uracil1939-C5)-methyltransferase|nr:23S rRNA (uracil(1939)-C(5))-methyltransferase RlmD [Arenicella sp.]